jgi:hypothetical protein
VYEDLPKTQLATGFVIKILQFNACLPLAVNAPKAIILQYMSRNMLTNTAKYCKIQQNITKFQEILLVFL